MSEIQRSLGPSITSGAGPARTGSRQEPAVRFGPEPQGAPAAASTRRHQDRLAPRPQSWFGSMRLTKEAPKPAQASAPTPPEPVASSSKKPLAAAAGAKGKSADDSVLRKMAYKAGPFERPTAHYWVGREVVTDQLEEWMGVMTNHAAFLGDKNHELTRKHVDLEARLKTAEQSVQALQRHMEVSDENLARAQAQSAFFEQFYSNHQATCEELTEIFHAAASAADESRTLARQGQRLAAQFKRPVAIDVASVSGASAASEAGSESNTFGS